MLRLGELFSSIGVDLAESARIFSDELRNEHPLIREFCEHIEQFHGKQLRPALLLLCARACGESRPEHRILAAVVEMVHIATLVHDDVLDDADIRRKAETVSRRWGNEQAVLLGDYLFSHAFRLCSSLDDQYASQLIGRTAVRLSSGEMLQVGHRDNYDLTEDEYFEIIAGKTASLIGTCCRLGARYAGADDLTVRRMDEFGTGLGFAFQITDDLLDLLGDEKVVGKSLGRDIDKGKLTLPLIHHLRNCDDRRRREMYALFTGRRARSQRSPDRTADPVARASSMPNAPLINTSARRSTSLTICPLPTPVRL